MLCCNPSNGIAFANCLVKERIKDRIYGARLQHNDDGRSMRGFI